MQLGDLEWTQREGLDRGDGTALLVYRVDARMLGLGGDPHPQTGGASGRAQRNAAKARGQAQTCLRIGVEEQRGMQRRVQERWVQAEALRFGGLLLGERYL